MLIWTNLFDGTINITQDWLILSRGEQLNIEVGFTRQLQMNVSLYGIYPERKGGQKSCWVRAGASDSAAPRWTTDIGPLPSTVIKKGAGSTCVSSSFKHTFARIRQPSSQNSLFIGNMFQIRFVVRQLWWEENVFYRVQSKRVQQI